MAKMSKTLDELLGAITIFIASIIRQGYLKLQSWSYGIALKVKNCSTKNPHISFFVCFVGPAYAQASILRRFLGQFSNYSGLMYGLVGASFGFSKA